MDDKEAASEAARALVNRRWKSKRGLAERQEKRRRRIAAELAEFPVSDDDARALMALLPPLPESPSN